MKSFKIFFAMVVAASLSSAATHAATQTTILNPGWNAVFLDVQPENTDPAKVFEGLPVESVWTRLDKNSSVEFIRDPDEGLWGQPGWHGYFTSEKEAPLTNLFAIFASRAYLIKLKGGEPATWTVTGAPTVGKIQWVADSFNLTGFRVNPANPPTFAAFFSPSTAHAGQAVYKLNNEAGAWEMVEDQTNTTLKSGEAYWVYCDGVSDYQQPLEIQLPQYDGMNYGAYVETLSIVLLNKSNTTITVNATPLTSNIDLSYRTFNEAAGAYEWPPLQNMPAVSLNSGASKILRIAVNRGTLASERAESAIQISDSQGALMLVPVSVEKEIP